MKKVLYTFLGLVAVVLLVGLGYLQHIKTKAIPDYNENILLSGISSDVEVLRDARGVPHIYASNEKDLYTATGYIMAQDRLWQMDLLRRVTTGRLSEIFGDKTIQTDLLMRALRIPEKSVIILDSLQPEMREALEYFADGVNQFIADNPDNLPPEFTILGYTPENWQAIHSVNLIGYMAWDLTSGWGNEFLLHKLKQQLGDKIKHFIPNMSKHQDVVFSDFVLDSATITSTTDFLDQTAMLESLGANVFFGSNNWAVSAKKSVTGKAIFANDMHLGLFAPGIWYQIHLVIDGKLDVTGLTIPGAPAVVAGHNSHIAWGMTNVSVDETDFYKETINPENKNQYKLDGEWRDFELKEETIQIKDGKAQKIMLQFTHRGPVVSSFKNINDEVISMQWLGFHYSNEIRSLYLLNRATNWADFRDAVKTFISVSQNIIYADTEGNIGLQTCAGLPIRKGSGINVYPGDTSLYDWTGIVPFEELPYSYNPECGYVASANNRTVGDDYPHYISHWFSIPYRYNRIVEMLEAKEKLSVDDFKRMHADQKSHLAKTYLPDIIAEIKQMDDLNANEKIGRDSLNNWNTDMATNAIAPTIFEEFSFQMIKNILKDDLDSKRYNEILGNKLILFNFIQNTWKSDCELYDNSQTSNVKETRSDIIRQSYRDAIASLENKYGENTNDWLWGNLHKITFKHPLGSVKILDILFGLNKGAYSVGGSWHTVSPYSYSLKAGFDATSHGASHRHIFTPHDWDASLTIIPTGTSGIPASDFYCNQTQNYINNQYYTDLFSGDKIKETAKFYMKFSAK